MKPGIFQDDNEDGSQVVGYVLVQVLVVFVVLGLLQIAFALHVRNIAIDAASEGARRAALLGASTNDGYERTTELLDDALGSDVSREIQVSEKVRDGDAMVRVQVSATLPILGPFGLPHSLNVSAGAFKEPDRVP